MGRLSRHRADPASRLASSDCPGSEDVIRAVEAVAAGEAVFGSQVAGRVLRYFTEPRPRPFPELTEREREVLDLMAAGLRNSQIAARLVLSPKTVRNHVSNLFTKLGVANRAEAVARAREAGLGVASPGTYYYR